MRRVQLISGRAARGAPQYPAAVVWSRSVLVRMVLHSNCFCAQGLHTARAPPTCAPLGDSGRRRERGPKARVGVFWTVTILCGTP
ncbi:hypothetical protein GN956_G16431 [Arapaima gigas]